VIPDSYGVTPFHFAVRRIAAREFLKMLVLKNALPVVRTYAATVYVKFDNTEREAQGTPDAIELNIENQNGMMSCFLYTSQPKLGSEEQAVVFVKELQQLDTAEIVEGRGDAA
jgi:hypothetical protein